MLMSISIQWNERYNILTLTFAGAWTQEDVAAALPESPANAAVILDVHDAAFATVTPAATMQAFATLKPHLPARRRALVIVAGGAHQRDLMRARTALMEALGRLTLVTTLEAAMIVIADALPDPEPGDEGADEGAEQQA